MTEHKKSAGKRILFVVGVIAVIIGGISLVFQLIYGIPVFMNDPVTYLTSQTLPALIWVTVGAILIEQSKKTTKKT